MHSIQKENHYFKETFFIYFFTKKTSYLSLFQSKIVNFQKKNFLFSIILVENRIFIQVKNFT